MEGCWRVTITSDMSSMFPVLLHLFPKETEAIWDAVSEYILEELKWDKGVQVAGLGTFAVVQEQFLGKQELLLVRRPFFQLDIDELWLEEIYCPTEILPDGVKIEPLNYVQLSQATSFPLHVVKNCVQETILLYCFLLRSKEHVPFGFRDIGVLTCEDGFLCMKFYLDCVKRLESTAGLVALLHSRMWPAHLTAFSGETTARGIQMFPRRVHFLRSPWLTQREASHLLLWNVRGWVSTLSIQSGLSPEETGSWLTNAELRLRVSSPGEEGHCGCVSCARAAAIPVRESCLHVEGNLGYIFWCCGKINNKPHAWT
ncbi:coiled-coil domain-containing protein 81-like isoform X2 [Cygnus olor]|uniref:coiled-coil domain-containing protein 81-like isoform X2 n=1 Tax=Cygnus olor TaxID=8869 RepID=UPI001ADE62BE|nr:coiled-coil domain-containing protein 81-like isoform X2 [Cygnus olor]